MVHSKPIIHGFDFDTLAMRERDTRGVSPQRGWFLGIQGFRETA